MIKIYGASDDLVIVEGDINGEFSLPYEEDDLIIALSSGHLFKISFGYCWKITTLHGRAKMINAIGPDVDERRDGTPGYSDVASVHEDIKWILVSGRLTAGCKSFGLQDDPQ